MIRFTGLFLAVLLIPLAFLSSLTAQSGQDIEKKVHDVKVRILELLEHAESLAEEGWETKSKQIRKQASSLKQELHDWLKKLEKRDSAKPQSEGQKIIAGLLAGARSLRHLGRIDQAEQLERIAKDVSKKLAKPHTKKAEGRSAKGNKREVVKRHLRVLRIAVVTLVEADKRESAERIEHFMHAVELAMEDRNDEKASRIRKSAPKPEQILDDLEIAVRILRKERQKEKAAAVLDTLRHLARRVKSQGKNDDEEGDDDGEEEGDEDEDEDDDEDESDDDEDENEERIEELEERMRKMERYLKELTQVLKQLKQRD